jgi:molecular chaperone DnaK (HSP70)
MAKHVFGIDLGTTFSCIACVGEDGKANIISNLEGTNTTPSVVMFESADNVIVGDTAQAKALKYPDKTVSFVKNLMGKTDIATVIDGRTISPEEVSSYILRKLASNASDAMGEPVTDVVITCPAYFGTNEREATKKAGIIAGLNVLEIISEPTAAAIYYAYSDKRSDQTVLVYDLGGGTFDVTIMEITSEKIEIICSAGDHKLGGKNWDDALMEYLTSKFRDLNNFNDEFSSKDIEKIRNEAVKIKRGLTASKSMDVDLSLSAGEADFTVSREIFEEITRSLLMQTVDKVNEAIADSEARGYGLDKIDEILLVGGSTRMPAVSEILTSTFNKSLRVVEPDEAVAKGAAIFAVEVYIKHQEIIRNWLENGQNEVPDNLSNETTKVLENRESYQEDLVVTPNKLSLGGKARDIIVATTKSYAVRCKSNGKLVSYNLILKNQPMKNNTIVGESDFFTDLDNQDAVNVIIDESDYTDQEFEIDDDYRIGNLILELPAGLPQGSPIGIQLILNTEGILSVTASDLTSHKTVNTTMQAKGIMSSEAVAELKEMTKSVSVK